MTRYKPLTITIREKCPECKKQAITVKTDSDDEFIYHRLTCGHLIAISKPKPQDIIFHSIDGEELYPFQKENVAKFAESGGRLALLDEMGLGKTLSALGIAKIYQLTPTLIICKSSLRYQWRNMIEHWAADIDDILDIPIVNVQIIESSQTPVNKAEYVIVSYDLLPRMNLEMFDNKFKLAIIDECQQIKNTESLRTRATGRALQTIPNLVFTSGTPIKNNAVEFYPMLHLIDPFRFPTKTRFIYEFVSTYLRGRSLRYGGIRNYEAFRNVTDKYIIRHTQKEVLPQLPDISRHYVLVPLNVERDKIREAEADFAEFYYKTQKEDMHFFQNILAYFSRMRHLTGLAKVEFATEYVLDFLNSTGRKIVVFTHHIDVQQILHDNLERAGIPVLALAGAMSGESKEEVKSKFNFDPEYKVLIASTLASGEGHNLQHSCSDAVMLERQWNPANEEQAEHRFKRPGQKESVINITYLIAEDSIDSYFTQLVEDKRKAMKYSLDGERYEWNQNELLASLANVIAQRGKNGNYSRSTTA